jgi:DNA repair exonuclease SbcCD ATPase subunit
MKTITDDDGNVYVLKTDMESVIKDRIAKVSARAQQAEEQVRTLQTDLDAAKQSAGTSDVLAQQLEEYREQLQQANSRFDRYKAISKHGLVDDDMIEAIEWSYEKSQSKVSKKDRVSLTDWLESAVSNPDNAPTVLRPHLMQLQQQANSEQANSEQVTSEPSSTPQVTPQVTQQTAPNVNAGAMPPVDGPDIIQRGLNDSDFYQSNRDAIVKQWRAKYGR